MPGILRVSVRWRMSSRLEQHLLDHGRFARRELADHAHHDRVLAVGDALDVEHRPGAPTRHVAGELAERSLGLGLVHRHLALDHELGARWDFEVDGLAFHHLHRRAADAAGDRQLVLAVARGRDQIVHGIGADVERRRHRSAAHLPFGVVNGSTTVRRAEQDAGLVRSLHLAAADAEVAAPGVGITRHPQRCEIRARVLAGRPHRRGDFRQIECIGPELDLLARPVLDHDGRDRRLDTALDAFIDRLRVRFTFEHGRDHVGRGCDHAGDHAGAGKAADIAETDADAALLRHRTEHQARDGADLPIAVDLAVHPLQQVLLLQSFQIGAQTVERHG